MLEKAKADLEGKVENLIKDVAAACDREGLLEKAKADLEGKAGSLSKELEAVRAESETGKKEIRRLQNLVEESNKGNQALKRGMQGLESDLAGQVAELVKQVSAGSERERELEKAKAELEGRVEGLVKDAAAAA